MSYWQYQGINDRGEQVYYDLSHGCTKEIDADGKIRVTLQEFTTTKPPFSQSVPPKSPDDVVEAFKRLMATKPPRPQSKSVSPVTQPTNSEVTTRNDRELVKEQLHDDSIPERTQRVNKAARPFLPATQVGHHHHHHHHQSPS